MKKEEEMIKDKKNRQESNDNIQEEAVRIRYEDAGIDSRILRAVRELGFEHKSCDRDGL